MTQDKQSARLAPGAPEIGRVPRQSSPPSLSTLYPGGRPVVKREFSASLLAAALGYAARGWAVFPLRLGTKTPLTNHGFKDATTDQNQIRTWWAATPDANIGIACEASNLVVVDCDVKEGAPGLESWRDLKAELGIGDATPCGETPSGGLHIYYSANGQAFRSTTGHLGAGLDTKAAGGYVVASPSRTDAGDYAWAMNHAPDEKPLAPIPEALARLLTVRPPSDRDDGEDPHAGTHKTPLNLLEELPKAAAALRELASRRADGYDDWLHVGMALYPLGDAGLQLWDAWSSRSPKKYQPGICAEKWLTFRETPLAGQDITLGSLFEWAREDTQAGIREAPGQAEGERPHITDMGNATRLVARHGQDLRFCNRLGGWLCWSGTRWAADETDRISHLGKDTVQGIFLEVAMNADSKERKEQFALAFKSEAAARIAGMIQLARPDLAAPPEQFDADPWLLNCANGTLDLRTGKLREHRRKDYITKLVPVDFEPGYRDEIFDTFLRSTTGGDPGLAAYLQRAAGYSLTGLTQEKIFFFVLGEKDSGKTTFAEAMLTLLGDYAHKASFATFLEIRGDWGKGAQPGLMALRGARFVAAVECPEKASLAGPLVKELTGRDRITTRQLYQKEITFQPVCKLWLFGNKPPKIAHGDDALWGRLRRVPFEVSHTDSVDVRVGPHLCSPEGGKALLAWAVEGCRMWQDKGLGTCDLVAQRTLELRAENDPLGEFLALECVLAPRAAVQAQVLRTAYENWAKSMGARPIGDREWGRRLKEAGASTFRKRTAVGRREASWQGIGLAGEGGDLDF